MSAFRISVRWPIYIINSVDKTKFLYTTSPPTQHHSFFRNYPFIHKLYGDRSFAASAPKLWNALPVDIKNSESLDIFKSKVKTHLFRQCYRV